MPTAKAPHSPRKPRSSGDKESPLAASPSSTPSIPARNIALSYPVSLSFEVTPEGGVVKAMLQLGNFDARLPVHTSATRGPAPTRPEITAAIQSKQIPELVGSLQTAIHAWKVKNHV